MKRSVFILSLVVLGAVLFSSGYFFKPFFQLFQKPHVMVRVDGVEITDMDLKREMLLLKAGDSSAPSEITREDVLDRMINDVLITAEAGRHNISVSDQEINDFLNAFWSGYDPREAKRVMREHRLSETAWRDLVRRRLMVEHAVKQLIEDQVVVTSEENDGYYWAHLAEFDQPPRVWARQIVVETKAQADALKVRLDRGENFQDLAKKFSRGPEKEQGGDLGWVAASDLPQAFSRVLFKMSPNETSAPVATEYGFHIFRLEKKEDGGRMPLETAKTKIGQDLKLAKTDQAFQTWLENLRSRATIVRLDQRGGA